MEGYTYVTNAVSHNPAVEKLRTVWDGLPGAQGTDVLLSVFDL